MNYSLVGPPQRCAYHVGGDNCHRMAEVVYIIHVPFGTPLFRFYCQEHYLEQAELDGGR